MSEMSMIGFSSVSIAFVTPTLEVMYGFLIDLYLRTNLLFSTPSRTFMTRGNLSD